MTSQDLGALGEALHALARVPMLLVACDYDGVIAPLADDPTQAHPNRSSVSALRTLAELPNTHVTVVSGRSLRDLATMSRLPAEIRLVGSHGSEFDLGFATDLSAELVERREALTDQVRALGQRYHALVEEKPTGCTFHFRGLEPDAVAAARDELVAGPATMADVLVRTGHEIIEFSVVHTNKGDALSQIRTQVSASAVIFMGDDTTDEDAFRTLTGPDVGVKIGDGATAAEYRIDTPDTVAQVLALLVELRSEWLQGAGLTPIEQHSILSDLRTVAVCTPQARVTWMCAPRIDSTAVFAELLGGPGSGYFSVSPADGAAATGQTYRPHSMVLETTFPTFTVSDYLDVSSGRTRRLAGRSDLIRSLRGSGEVLIEFAPRIDFGRVSTRLDIRPEGIAVLGSADLMVLRAPGVEWELISDGIHQTARGRATLGPESLTVELRAGTGTLRADSRTESQRQEDSERYWVNWASRLDLPRTQPELVERSALAIKSLSHRPTGAILSAATTSLPEHLGGVRNWDYRYCWLRDAAMSARALARLDSHAEGMAFLDWVLSILSTRSDPERLAPLYNVTGRHLPPEAEIAELPGYGGSRPVRVGNAADGQVQLDVFGPIVELVNVLLEGGEALSAEHWRLVEAMVLAVSRRWTEPDHGIWEIRRPPRQHVYSKVMCWLTVDRAIAIADQFLDREPTAWVDLRDRIADDVLTNGWKQKRGSFTAAYDGDDLDAAVLAVGLSGLIEASDPRFVSTVEAIERELRDGPTVYRYLEDDGLPGREGGFHMMMAWLIDSLILIGRHDDAEAMFNEMIGLVGPTGLLSEQYDPLNNRSLGNFPQAYSHLALINTALNLDGR